MSLKSSTKLKKILEVSKTVWMLMRHLTVTFGSLNPFISFQIVLAFGNYMNSSKRGAACGFRLQSLDLVSSVLFLFYFILFCLLFNLWKLNDIFHHLHISAVGHQIHWPLTDVTSFHHQYYPGKIPRPGQLPHRATLCRQGRPWYMHALRLTNQPSF